MIELIPLCLIAFFAGFIDSVVGGGGLIQLPGLMLIYPSVPFSMLAGTNKVSSMCGTFCALLRYTSKVKIARPIFMFCLPAAVIFSFLGAKIVASLDSNLIKPIIVAVLIAVGIYTFLRPNVGSSTKLGRVKTKTGIIIASIIIGIALGFYDGLIGPGTGSFLIFAFIMLLGMDFFNASANAKVINLGTNVAAATFFILHDQVIWPSALVMAASNIAGAIAGTSMAIKKGNSWIRKVFLIVVALILVKLIIDLL